VLLSGQLLQALAGKTLLWLGVTAWECGVKQASGCQRQAAATIEWVGLGLGLGFGGREGCRYLTF